MPIEIIIMHSELEITGDKKSWIFSGNDPAFAQKPEENLKLDNLCFCRGPN
jgi:hypothetical protein